jgi:GNAT superfamily N-acetyltransferase
VTVAGLEIRPLAERELGRVCGQMSWRPAVMHEQRLREQLEGRYRYLIAFMDAVAIGHVGLFLPHDRNIVPLIEFGRCGLVHDLFVAPGFRGRGIGRALMQELERRARAGGLGELALGTGLDDGYQAARTLYRSMGWERTTGPFIESGGPAAGDDPPIFIEILTTWRKRLP